MYQNGPYVTLDFKLLSSRSRLIFGAVWKENAIKIQAKLMAVQRSPE